MAELGAADPGVGDPQDGVLVDDGVQVAGAGVAGEDLLALQAGVAVARDFRRVADAGGAGDDLDVAGDLEQAGDEGGLEGADRRGAGLESG